MKPFMLQRASRPLLFCGMRLSSGAQIALGAQCVSGRDIRFRYPRARAYNVARSRKKS
jgi:hypothetical protein